MNSQSTRVAGADGKVIEAVGLALSGGGIRSAAFSLGVLQALNHHEPRQASIICRPSRAAATSGSALTATMTKTGGDFVFGRSPDSARRRQLTAEISDTAAVGHLRNYSNYLIPSARATC